MASGALAHRREAMPALKKSESLSEKGWMVVMVMVVVIVTIAVDSSGCQLARLPCVGVIQWASRRGTTHPSIVWSGWSGCSQLARLYSRPARPVKSILL